ncbi:MAG: F0F1 ATP synthase subunit B [Candidatus Saccharimonadales bacterium]
MNILTQLATTEAVKGGIFEALGIDWKTLIFQIIAFLILVFLLGRFVYPVLMKSVDKRQAEIQSASEAALEAEKKATAAEKNIEKLLAEARKEASDIVTTAKDESAALSDAADKKAKARAEHIVEDAREQLEKDVIAARKTLHNDTIDLVALATEKVIGKTITPALDKKIIAGSVKEVS